MPDTKILYHANCDDGFGSAWAAWKRYWDEADYIPVQYGQPVPDLPPSDVLICDFSYDRSTIESLHEYHKSIYVLDHHKTAEEELKNLYYCIFDMNKSGAVLAWEWFFPEQPVPILLQYVQDRDLWRNELFRTEEATAWRRSWPQTFEQWDILDNTMRSAQEVLAHNQVSSWVEQGSAILRSNRIQIKKRVAQAVETIIGSHRVLAVNETQFFSEVAGELAKIEGYPFGACYFIRGDGRRQWSLRSVGGFDVSEVAKSLGGGGHRNAAGFTE